MASSPTILTFDIGGTATRVGVFKNGEVTQLGQAPTPNAQRWGNDDVAPVSELLKTLTDTAVQGASSYDAVGVSVTGMLRMVDHPDVRTYGPFKNYDLMLSSPNLAGLENVEIFGLLEGIGWGVPIHVENDANAALRSATDYDSAVGINMGTGIAAAVKQNGVIRRNEPFWSCYEIGHGFRWTFPEQLTRKCVCGAMGCLEAVIGSRALRERYGVRPENASPEIYARMREDLMTYAAPAILDTAKRFRQSQILLSGRSILGFSKDRSFVEQMDSAMRSIDPEAEFSLKVLDLPDTSGMLGVAFAMFDHHVI